MSYNKNLFNTNVLELMFHLMLVVAVAVLAVIVIKRLIGWVKGSSLFEKTEVIYMKDLNKYRVKRFDTRRIGDRDVLMVVISRRSETKTVFMDEVIFS